MLIAVEHPLPVADDCHDLELRWVASVDGAPAAHHTLRSADAGALTALLRRGPLPRWSAAPHWGSLHWRVDVRPRVLRETDPGARDLGVSETAAALVVVERGTGPGGAAVEHELVVLAAYAGSAGIRAAA